VNNGLVVNRTFKLYGGYHMKKFLAMLLSASLVWGIGISASAEVVESQSKDVQKAYELIDNTNEKINKEIQKAKDAASKLQAKYIEDVKKLQEREANKTDKSTVTYQSNSNIKQNEVTLETIQELLQNLETEVFHSVVQSGDNTPSTEEEVKEIAFVLATGEKCDPTKGLCIEEGDTDYLKKEYTELTDKYLQKLTKIITDVYNETLKMSTKTIEKAKELGLNAKCEWTLVDFAHLKAWIDPIRVVGV
jgi:ribosomal protein S13